MSHNLEQKIRFLNKGSQKNPKLKLTEREESLQAVSSGMCYSEKSEIIWNFN